MSVAKMQHLETKGQTLRNYVFKTLFKTFLFKRDQILCLCERRVILILMKVS
jgi:hypothetical protein